MAIVKALNNKNQSGGGLSSIMKYAKNEKKTLLPDGRRLVSGIRCSPEFAYDEFMLTKRMHNKCNGKFFYHYCQSFSPKENVSPDKAHEIGIRLAKECFNGYEVLVSTHIEKEHIHNHIIVNSVNAENGRKLHQDNKSLERIRNISDGICIEYGLSIIENKEQKSSKNISYGEYSAATKGQSWKYRLINIIEDAMKICQDKKEFISYLESEGYYVKWEDGRKSICYTTPQGKKCRDCRLHEDKFLKENMENEFRCREIERNEPSRSENRFDADTYSAGSSDREYGEDIGTKQQENNSGYEFSVTTGWEYAREYFYANRAGIKEDLREDISNNADGWGFDSIDYGTVKRVLGLVKSVSGISKKRDYDEDDTLALSVITGLTAGSVALLIGIINSTNDEELTENFIKEAIDGLREGEQAEMEFGEISM